MRQRHLSGRFHGRFTLRYFFQTFEHVLVIVYLPTSSFLPSPDKVANQCRQSCQWSQDASSHENMDKHAASWF
ncbi:hypothetical protein CGGC5_v000672 [Colletotrichum fructicola Nara gc5]|uniref:Uncharacterized protein n=1 Tax=Colletotrichum fructicola (strain Nara gc5) TaxID=1213859 RepID=A0A7J6JR93_COLFN|nr:hypothetical protein CGGC5_v000672 [Colletotrichum fructicola Nara gc5]